MGRPDQKGPRPSRDLQNRPFKAALKDVKVRPPGPDCLRCLGPIDTRPGSSLPYPRGSRKSQRHGYLHQDCELQANEEIAKRQGKEVSWLVPDKVGPKKKFFLQPGVQLEVPVYTEEELDGAIEAGVVPS